MKTLIFMMIIIGLCSQCSLIKKSQKSDQHKKSTVVVIDTNAHKPIIDSSAVNLTSTDSTNINKKKKHRKSVVIESLPVPENDPGDSQLPDPWTPIKRGLACLLGLGSVIFLRRKLC